MTSDERLSSSLYVSFLEEREKKQHQENLKWRKEVLGRLVQAINFITSQYSIASIILFGSLIGEDFNSDSDVDLYIEELSGADYFEVKRALEDILNLDVDLYTQSDRFQFVERIKQRGVTIYEREVGIINCQH